MSDPLLFFNEFQKAVCKLVEVSESLSEIEKFRYMIKALLRSYVYVCDFIDLLPEPERILTYVKSHWATGSNGEEGTET